MSNQSVAREVARWTLGVVLVLGGFQSLYLAAFHSWASWGPPTPNPEWHRTLSHRFVLIGLLCFVLAGVTVRFFAARRARADDPHAGSREP